MSQSLFDARIERLRESGVDPLIATPSELAELWERARADGRFRLGRLIAVRAPLWWRSGAAHDPTTGDAWVRWHPDAPERSRRNLLHELAHNRRNAPRPATVAEDWRDELETWQEAAALGSAWGLDLFPDDVLDELCALTELLGAEHQAAAELAGTTDPRLARAAHIALCDLAETHGWDRAAFDGALYGVHRDAALNDAAVAFDRTALRGAWSVGHGVGGTFGDFAIADEHAGSWLRDALRRVARGERQRSFTEPRAGQAEPKLLWFGELASDDGLPAALGACQTALLAHAGPALAFWTLYADRADAAQVLHLRVAYQAQPDGTAPLPAEVWVALHPHRKARGRTAAAALQRYVESWRAMTWLSVAPLAEGYARGLSALWSRLGAR